VLGDGSPAFHADEWQRCGIRFVPCERTTSENYLHALPMLLAGRVRLIDNATLRAQLASLERRVRPPIARRSPIHRPPRRTTTARLPFAVR
jgi:hypothetical protein